MGIDNIAYEVQTQADRLFPNRTDTSMFLKLYGELGELVESGSHDEFADVMILILDYGSRHMIDIEGAIRRKMVINESRTWKTNVLGVNQHV